MRNETAMRSSTALTFFTTGLRMAFTGPARYIFDLEPGVIGALRASLLGELFRRDNLVNQNADAGTESP
jgi:hypothetical protein